MYKRQGLNRSGKAASAVGGEGNNGLAAEIIGFQEGIEGHGKVSIPIRIPEEDNIIALGLLDLAGKLGAGAFGELIVGKF